MHVYERVREYIEEQGLTESDVAEAAGIPNVTFSAMMSGKKKMYADDLRAVCLALKVSADRFIGKG